MGKATAVAHPNIAFVKYWGKIDRAKNLPANPSLSMNLEALVTTTTVEFAPDQRADRVVINQRSAEGSVRERVTSQLDRVRSLAGIEHRATVTSLNSFPSSTGLASSSSGFAALSLAATHAAGIGLDDQALSRLARLGSGSACRSIPAGYALWEGEVDSASFAVQFAPPEHWALWDVIVIVSKRAKSVSSQDGHTLAATSSLHPARLARVPALLSSVQEGIRNRDLDAMGPAVEEDALMMHAVMMTSQPSLWYWQPETLAVLLAVQAWRREGLGVFFTLDAGPNVHCICEAQDVADVEQRLLAVPGVLETRASGPGGPTRLVDTHLA